MAMNRVQFQKGLSMVEFSARYGTEAKCRRALYTARWPEGFCCVACGGRHASRFRRDRQVYWQCCACRKQTTLLTGTLFAGSKIALSKWFLALHLLSATKTNLSALELMRHLGVCYRTAWRLKHKVMQAMTAQEESRQLHGFVQIDDTYLGGERSGGKPYASWQRCSNENGNGLVRQHPPKGTDFALVTWSSTNELPKSNTVSTPGRGKRQAIT